MNNPFNTICGAHKVNHSSLSAEHYASMDLCSQAQMSEDADNILSRMDKLRAFAKEQQAARAKSQRRQISFCF
ncbi:hypothetical protein [uncultured Paraglaciecola sp.]|uniref:hypothetical protein n=1 Tax=uncultured Paraglaciecola sp. TaxID=1765024 RepID=UPI0030D91698|tara:strand:+ start:31303 stop:31521 length:219 start_codon:yes stop_codon:yes gene_type:complete